MSIRLGLLRWINEKCPQMKASNIESLADGRHFLCLLKRYFPEIEVPEKKKNSTVVQRLENLSKVQTYCQRLDMSFRFDLLKIANKESLIIINLIKFIKSILDKTPNKKSQILEENTKKVKDDGKRDTEIICEETPVQCQKHFSDSETQTYFQIENQISQHSIKGILQMKLQSPFLELELIKLLDQNDPQIIELQEQILLLLQKRSKNRSKFTEFMSIHSSQFYNRGDQNLMEPDYSFEQFQQSKKSAYCDSLFQVSDEKQNN